MIYGNTDEVIEKPFELLLDRYQDRLETSMRGSDFIFHLLYHKCHKINPNEGGSHADSPGWIKHKKSIINPINKSGNTL